MYAIASIVSFEGEMGDRGLRLGYVSRKQGEGMYNWHEKNQIKAWGWTLREAGPLHC